MEETPGGTRLDTSNENSNNSVGSEFDSADSLLKSVPIFEPCPTYRQKDLLDIMGAFIRDPKVHQLNYLEHKIKDICKEYKEINQNRLNSGFGDIEISILKHSHYMIKFREISGQNTEEVRAYETRIQQFQPKDVPDDNVYKLVLKILKFFSRLMLKWELFDAIIYSYRYRGRTLTVKLLDMIEINKQALSPDIIWFSYAINYMPFKGKVDKILYNYAKILQYELRNLFEFIKNYDVLTSDYNLAYNSLSFERVPGWKRIFGIKNQPAVERLYKQMESVELAYRYFEKHLIQEFLKLI
jgi:hypothetical protein